MEHTMYLDAPRSNLDRAQRILEGLCPECGLEVIPDEQCGVWEDPGHHPACPLTQGLRERDWLWGGAGKEQQ